MTPKRTIEGEVKEVQSFLNTENLSSRKKFKLSTPKRKNTGKNKSKSKDITGTPCRKITEENVKKNYKRNIMKVERRNKRITRTRSSSRRRGGRLGRCGRRYTSVTHPKL